MVFTDIQGCSALALKAFGFAALALVLYFVVLLTSLLCASCAHVRSLIHNLLFIVTDTGG